MNVLIIARVSGPEDGFDAAIELMFEGCSIRKLRRGASTVITLADYDIHSALNFLESKGYEFNHVIAKSVPEATMAFVLKMGVLV